MSWIASISLKPLQSLQKARIVGQQRKKKSGVPA
jgi:hypothetical protein